MKFRNSVSNSNTHKAKMVSPLITSKSKSEILNLINQPNEKAQVDKYGEVFTPLSLVNTIYNNMGRSSLWKNQDTTLLDPAAGIGHFTVHAYYRFMDSLKDTIADERKRSKHIIQNILYMVELNPENCKLLRSIFGRKANIFCGSFLNKSLNGINPEVFPGLNFTIIVGNPPYQQERPVTTGTNAGRKTLWDKFAMISLGILKPRGYLAFIHPAGWRAPGGRHSYLWKTMTGKQILLLQIFSKEKGQKLFNVSQRFDLYILRNAPNTQRTKIIDEKGKVEMIDLSQWPFLPNYLLSFFASIIVPLKDGIDVLYSTDHHTQKQHIRPSPDAQHCHNVIHQINKNGLGFWYSKSSFGGHFGVPKVVLNFNRNQYNYPEQNDFKGEFGMSQLSFGIPIKTEDEGKCILNAIKTPLFQDLINATKWHCFQTNYRMFNYFTPNVWKIINNS